MRISSLCGPSRLKETDKTDYIATRFGRQLRRLRLGRKLSQEALAERCGLSCDAIRRLERGGFSPTLATLAKLSNGLALSLSSFFEGIERELVDEVRELADYLNTRSRREQRMAVKVVRALFEE